MIKLHSQLTMPLQYLLICCTLLIPTLSLADLDDGLQAYNDGDYTTARLEWMTAAEQGDPIAQYNLGQIYRLGRGTLIDYHQAADYYLLAARQGHVGAQRNLGYLYYHGRLGRAQRDQAYSWLARAAAQDDSDSQWSVGTMLYNGDMVESDPVKAYAWYWLATQNGHENGQYALAALDKKLTAKQIKAGRTMAPSLLRSEPTPIHPAKNTPVPKNADKAVIDNNPKQPTTDKPSVAIPAQKVSPQKALTTEIEPDKTEPVKFKSEDKFRVQLAALRSQEAADKVWNSLSKEVTKLISPYQRHTVVSDAGDKGTYFRLQLSPFATPETARKLCDQLKANKQACFFNKTAGK